MNPHEPALPGFELKDDEKIVRIPSPPDEHPTWLPAYSDCEVVIAWVGAIGTDLKQATDIARALLRNYRYDTREIRISKLLEKYPGYENNREVVGAYKFYQAAIKAGNSIRDELNANDALAQLTSVEIARLRAEEIWEFENRRAYIIHQLKLPEEIIALRRVYGELFYSVAVYSHDEVRQQRLVEKCNETYGFADIKAAEKEAIHLLNQDEHEELEAGQNVQETFVEADFYIRSDETQELSRSIARFLKLIFDEPFVSPTKAEVAMAQAQTAAFRSADLSRQIGAAISDRDGRILTTGCNEVPRAGGGQYWVDDLDDARDFQRREDINDRKKRESVIELSQRINDFLRPDLQGNPTQFYNKELKDRLKGTRADSILEFSRVIHAEMAAMNVAAMDAIAIRDADLYCTTFPCHLCSKQIINVGIRNVFYIEPYPKSLTKELFSDSVMVNPALTQIELENRLSSVLPRGAKVAFIPFSGVAPRRYAALFANKRRKHGDGTLKSFERQKATLRRPPIAPFHEALEAYLTSKLSPIFDAWKAKDEQLRQKKETVGGSHMDYESNDFHEKLSNKISDSGKEPNS